MCEPVFQHLPNSYTWPLKKTDPFIYMSSQMLTYSYTAFWFFVPIYCWLLDKYRSQLNTKKTSSLQKSLSENYVHIPGCQKSGAFHIGIQKNWVIYILFVEKGGQSYTWQRWKRGPFGTHIRTMPYIGSYPPPPHTHTHTHTRGPDT